MPINRKRKRTLKNAKRLIDRMTYTSTFSLSTLKLFTSMFPNKVFPNGRSWSEMRKRIETGERSPYEPIHTIIKFVMPAYPQPSHIDVSHTVTK